MTGKPTKIILHCPLSHPALLHDLMETWLQDGVELISVLGAGSEDVHDLIDDIIIQHDSRGSTDIVTTWHNDETLSDVIEFASTFGNADAIIKQVRL